MLTPEILAKLEALGADINRLIANGAAGKEDKEVLDAIIPFIEVETQCSWCGREFGPPLAAGGPRQPMCDCLARWHCPEAGLPGHRQCGPCKKPGHRHPAFVSCFSESG